MLIQKLPRMAHFCADTGKTSRITNSRCQDTSGPWEPSCPSSGDINVHFLTDDSSLCIRNAMEIPKCCHLESTLRESARCRAGAPLLHSPPQFQSQPRQGTDGHSRVALLLFVGFAASFQLWQLGILSLVDKMYHGPHQGRADVGWGCVCVRKAACEVMMVFDKGTRGTVQGPEVWDSCGELGRGAEQEHWTWGR